MQRIPRLLLSFLAVFAAASGGSCFLFNSYPVPEQSDYSINLDRMRAAASAGGAPPLRLNSLLVGEGEFPRGAVVATDSLFEKRRLVFTAFQAVYADQTVIIDTAHDKRLHEEFFSGTPFYEENFDALQAAMRKATLILATHEHMDHVGGIAHSPFFDEIVPRVALTREQIEGPTIAAADFAEGALARLKPLEYEGVYSPAPGIALQKAAGHSQGSQLIFVRLASGAEFLFVGDIAWNMDNVTRLTGRPWLVSYTFLKEDRAAVAHQLRALYNLKAQNPDLRMIVAHDPAEYEEYIQKGWIGAKFE
jgi:glyoxylase-like metal-dependent hydrolase (beta-lactamase superfamily II)